MTTTIELAEDQAALVYSPDSSTPRLVLPQHENPDDKMAPHELFTAALAYLSPRPEFQHWVFNTFDAGINTFLDSEEAAPIVDTS